MGLVSWSEGLAAADAKITSRRSFADNISYVLLLSGRTRSQICASVAEYRCRLQTALIRSGESDDTVTCRFGDAGFNFHCSGCRRNDPLIRAPFIVLLRGAFTLANFRRRERNRGHPPFLIEPVIGPRSSNAPSVPPAWTDCAPTLSPAAWRGSGFSGQRGRISVQWTFSVPQPLHW